MNNVKDIREGFLAVLDVECVIVDVDDCRDIPLAKLDKMVGIFNRYGFFVIQHGQFADPREQLISLGRFFGTTYGHNRADAQGIVPITPIEGLPEYVGASNSEHSLHTDGAYDDSPPKFLCLQCEVPASTGGLSTMVSGKALYDWLEDRDPECLAALFEPDALRVKRANQEDTKAIFSLQDGRCSIVWRADHTATFSPKPRTQRAVALLKEYIANEENVLTFKLLPNQIIVADNSATLHGRTSFPTTDKRKLNRINFNGDTPFAENKMMFGFNPYRKANTPEWPAADASGEYSLLQRL